MNRLGSVTVRTPAKINLELRVGAPRADGYHELATVFQALDLTDDVTVSRTGAALSDGFDLTVTGDVPELDGVPRDGTNLAARAVRLLAEEAELDPDDPAHGVRIAIRKHIPVAGGMAGGSADAAAALLAADALWHTGVSRDRLRELAAELGSDVPFPMLGGTAIGTGRGELLAAAMCRGTYTWVIALAGQGLPTPGVFAELDRLRAGRPVPEPGVSDQLLAALRSGDARAVGACLGNDLQGAACRLRPELWQTLEVGDEADALGSLVSGSGPTVVFLAVDGEHALDIEAALTAADVCTGVLTVTGPAHGARVVG